METTTKTAKDQLKETNKQISTIAFDVGFNSKSTFNTALNESALQLDTLYS